VTGFDLMQTFVRSIVAAAYAAWRSSTTQPTVSRRLQALSGLLAWYCCKSTRAMRSDGRRRALLRAC
jgi:hypothetical protein